VLRPREARDVSFSSLAVEHNDYYSGSKRMVMPASNTVLHLPDGRVAVSFDDHFVRVFTPGLPFGWVQMGGEGSQPGQFKFPQGMATDGELLWVCDSGQDRLQAFRLSNLPERVYEWSRECFHRGPALLIDDRLYVGSGYDHALHVFDVTRGSAGDVSLEPCGRIGRHEHDDETCRVPSHSKPDALAYFGSELFVLCRGQVLVLDLRNGGEFVRSFGEYGGAPGQSQWGHGLATTSTGLLVMSEIHGERLQVLTRSGDPVQELGGCQGSSLSVRGQQLYVARSGRLACFEVDESGVD